MRGLEIKSKQMISNKFWSSQNHVCKHGLFRNVILCTHYYASKRQNSFLALYWPSRIKSNLFFLIGEFQTLFRDTLKTSNFEKSYGDKPYTEFSGHLRIAICMELSEVLLIRKVESSRKILHIYLLNF